MLILNVSGNITADAIIRTINGNTVVAFTIASNSRYKTREGCREDVTFVRCAIWNKPEVAKLLHRGRVINATGSFKPNIWHDADGVKQISIDLRVSFFQVFGKNKKEELTTETFTTEQPALTEAEQQEAVKDLPF
jgi:single-strand DNA-binding protein